MKNKKQLKRQYNSTKKGGIFDAGLKKRILYIIICAIPVYILADEKSALRLIIIPFFIFGMMQLLSLIVSIPFLIEKYLPTKTYNKQSTLFEKAVYYFTAIYLILSMVFMLVQGRTMENTIGDSSLFWKYGGIGFGSAIFFLIVLNYIAPSLNSDFNRRVALWFCIPIGSLVLFPAIICFMNTIKEPEYLNCSEFKVVSKFTTGKRNSTHKMSFITKYGEENFKINRSFYDSINANEVIECCSYKGNLGYEVIVKFNKIKGF
ncbi:hypothetical protein [Flavobacterium sp.]|jgi:hypothetical protein|uniref:hypothetical protein n=1 Tax=Flavobacterium sp. TaxID=239 RepID=UPI002A8222B1|nr:hypothetical protein [Flavobacterium sp.]